MGEQAGRAPQSLRGRGRRSFQSLSSRIVLAVFAATLVTSLVVAWVSTQAIESFLRDKIDQKFPTLLRAASARLDLWYAQHELDVETLARSAILVGNVEHLARAGDSGERAREEVAVYLSYVLERFSHYEALYVLDRDGVPLLTSGAENELPQSLRHALSGTAAPGVSGLHDLDGRSVQFVSAPAGEGGTGASFHAVLNGEELVRLLGDEELGEVSLYVVDRYGRVLLRSPSAPALSSWDRPQPAPGASLKLADYTHAEGAQMIGSSMHYPRLAWTLVVEQPYVEAFNPVVALVRRIFAVNLGIIAFFCVIAYGIARSIVRPIRRLSDGAERLALGESDVEIPESQRSDEISVLTRAFNAMLARLRQNQAELQQKNEDLQRVNEVFEQLSITDGLTKLHNHRFFQDHMPLEIRRADRTGEPLALALFDIDDFKKLNDSYGHATGDEVLRSVAAVMLEEVRDMDLLARYGGEEFALLAINTDLGGAVTIAEKVRAAVARTRFPFPEGASELSVTLSVGVAAYHGDRAAFFNAADRALYAAKDAGKDCVMASGEGEGV